MKYDKRTKNNNAASAMDFCLRKLSYSMRTEHELKKLMETAEYTEEEIIEALLSLKDFGYIDDNRYAEEFFKLGKSKGWSKMRIERELSLRGVGAGISRDIIEELSSEIDEREEAFLIAKKMLDAHISSGKAFDEKIKAKIGRRLISLGYNEGICYHVINKLRP